MYAVSYIFGRKKIDRLRKVSEVPPETMLTVVTCHSLLVLDNQTVGDPMEKAVLDATPWELGKSMRLNVCILP
jgi:magnesium-transporting ATPase (P-type)